MELFNLKKVYILAIGKTISETAKANLNGKQKKHIRVVGKKTKDGAREV